MPKIYTKVGDKGDTQLVGGQKVSKDDLRIASYGTIDELNSFLGWARLCLTSLNISWVDEDLKKLQNHLFDLGSLLATLSSDRSKFKLPNITEKQVTELEKRIDQMSAELKPLKNFILPGDTEAAARLHICRTVARRAEREMIKLKSELPENSIPYINRVSDYLFTLARYCNHVQKKEETIWEKSSG